MNTIEYRAIGLIRTPFIKADGTPIQPTAQGAAEAVVEVFPEYSQGLADLDGFSHIILLYHLHKSRQHSLTVKPFLDDKTHGLFATRAPSRPNAIGLSVVCLIKIEGNKLYIKEADMLDGTPLLDIKPYVPEFDVREVQKTGWLADASGKLEKTKDDGRFSR
ncbi:MAG: tRNA (N6-threonylcarbamoyladenosine(37)-N6)-methyltransferase TrmO [Desulfococcaceae bacterium]